MSIQLHLKRRYVAVLFIVAVIIAFAFNPFGSFADATHQPADKIAVAGSGLDIFEVSTIPTNPNQDGGEILRGRLRTSKPTDLIIDVSAECALWTDITTANNQESEAFAQVKVWVELGEGNVVPVASNDVNEPGKVVFCDRTYRRIFTTNSEDQFTIESYLRTRSAHSFNWITLNVGSGVHDIIVKAELIVQQTGTGPGRAMALVGKRTLVVQPVKLANDAKI